MTGVSCSDPDATVQDSSVAALRAASTPSILIVEDDHAIADSIALNLREEGFRVTVARRGDEGLALARTSSYALLVLDRMLPGLSGDMICREVREHSHVPILILSVLSSDDDKVEILDAGADDYLGKPFNMRELLARVRALLRRSGERVDAPEEIYHVGGVLVDVTRHRVVCDGKTLALRPKQFELLRVLIANRGRVMSRARLMDLVWGGREYPDDATLEVHVRWLRQQLEVDPARPRRILTVRGVGYQYMEDAP